MKIPQTIRLMYDRQREVNQLLERRVKEIFEGQKRSGWFYKGRLKELESFTQKIETGAVEDPLHLEDYFACTLVVENRGAIAEGLKLVNEFCDVLYQRPKNAAETHKKPDSFPFDDLRLYARLKTNEITPNPSAPLYQTTFEIQIKTFLQHAWAIATHDLIYKGTTLDWAEARVAYQIKAMLEHVEVSIEKVSDIASSTALATSDFETRKLQEILTWLNATWQEEQLPRDRVRLAKTLSELLKSLQLEVADLIESVTVDSNAGRGINTRNLSTYGAIVQAIVSHRSSQVHAFLHKKGRTWGLKRLLLIPEMEIQPEFLEGANPDRIVRTSI